jgi:hypothetical protein
LARQRRPDSNFKCVLKDAAAWGVVREMRKMIFGRVTAWLRFKLAAPPHAEAGTDRPAFDLDEFARLLYSGEPDDLKRIARDFRFSYPAEIRRRLQNRVSNQRVQK